MDATGNQTTLARPFALEGIGVHGGRPARVTVSPAPAGHGIVFRLARRRLLAPFARGGVDVPAHAGNVTATRLATVLAARGARPVRTVEHLMSAVAGLAVDNALVAVEGPEVPILDGSARPFAEAVEAAGIVPLDAPRDVIRVLRPVEVRLGERRAAFAPSDDDRLHLDVTIDFPETAIGRQRIALRLEPAAYALEIAPARTFGRLKDLKPLRRLGFARGASLDNAVGVDGDRILNPGGLRFPDEFVRHKALDAVGDLALAGRPIAGRFTSEKGGHRLNHMAVAALLAEPGAFRVERAGAALPLARLEEG